MTVTPPVVCDHCGRSLAWRGADGRTKIAVKGVVACLPDGTTETVCKHCGRDTRVPLRLALPEPAAPRPEPLRTRLVVRPGVVRRIVQAPATSGDATAVIPA